MNTRLQDIIINGEPHRSHSMTTSSFITSIGLSILLCVTCSLAFSTVRKRLRSVYEPRTYVVAQHMRRPPTSHGFFSWLPATLQTSNNTILGSSGLDAYFFLRYIAFVMSLSVVLGLPLLCILLPIHLSGNREGVFGLDHLSAANLSDSQVTMHIAHLIFCIVFTFSSLMIFKYELLRYFRMRANHIVAQGDESPGPASTILVRNLHSDYQTEQDICRFFSGLASSTTQAVVQKVWFNRNYSELHSLVKKRNKVLKELERLELWIIERCLGIGCSESTPVSNGNKDALIVGNLWRDYMNEADLAQMNGSKGARLSWLKGEMSRLNSEIYQIQIREASMPGLNSCFVQFDSKLSAFIASRSLGSDKSLGIGEDVYNRIHPADIVWSNLSSLTWFSLAVSWIATFLDFALIFGWAIPITLISMMAQSSTVAEAMPTFQWMLDTPKLSSFMSNVMAPLFVSALTAQVPSVFRFLAKLKGYPSYMRVEADVQKYLFMFMFFQLFLIVTLSTGLPGLMVQVLLNTSEGAITLASSLSKASTFFISYIMATSLTTAGNYLLQLQQLFVTLWYSYRERTPRERLENKCRYSTIHWGTVFPLVTHIGVIAISYALISPVIMLSAIVGLGALYIAFKYRILYCNLPRCVADGDYYPKAIFQLFSGFYCQQVSLLGTLLVSRQLVLAVLLSVLIIITVVSQHHLNRLFLDLSTRIPMKQSTDLESQDGVAEMQNEKSGKSGSKQSPEGRHEGPRASPSTLVGSPLESPLNQSPLNQSPLQSPQSDKRSAQSPTSFMSSIISSSPLLNSPLNDLSPLTPCTPPRELGFDGDGWATTDALQRAWTGIFDTVLPDFSSLSAEQKAYISSQLFEHPDQRMPRPCVWIPRDWKGIAQDQMLEMQNVFTDLRCSCHGADLDSNGDMVISQLPPDFDPLEVIKI